jgi:adenylate cyclase
MSETRKLAAILVSDVVGYSRLAGADEDRILARLRALRSDLIDPTIAVHHGRVVKRTGDGSIIEFRSVVDAVRCAVEIQHGMIERNSGLPPERRIEFRIGVHLGDVVEEADGDLMGDGVNIAARLESVAEPGAICLSEQAYWQVKGRLDLKVTDLGPVPLKNIAEPMRAYALEVGAPHEARSPSPGNRAKQVASKPRWLSAPLAAVAALVLLAVAGGWYILNGRAPKPAEAAHLSIAVLPFANLSGDPSQDYFADGITENLITELSRIHDSFVIARNTAFTFKGKSIDAKEIGKELGVRYVLEGSVQRDQSRVRVNAQLVDAESGARLRADRFDEVVADLFKLQDEVVTRLACNLNLAMVKPEAEKGSRSKNPDAVDLTMRVYDLILHCPKEYRDCNHDARALDKRALQIDPNDAGALAQSDETYFNDWFNGWGDPGTDYEAKVLGPANRAISLAPADTYVYYPKAIYLAMSGRHREALDAANAGLAINPNDVLLYTPRAIAENCLGQYEQAKADVERAMRLSPHDPALGGSWQAILGDAELGLGHFDAAIDAYRKAFDMGLQGAFFVHTNLAATYAQAGKMDEAKAEVAEARRLNPAITVKWMKEHTPNLPAVFDGLRKAGLPEE